MAFTSVREPLRHQLDDIRAKGLEKIERYIHSEQGAEIVCEFPAGAEVRQVLNFCANNYLGLSSHPAIKQAAHEALDRWGYGLSSVRFICGTQDIHRQLEQKTSEFLGTEDTILFSSCFDANAAAFAFLEKGDLIIADRLIHASIVDGILLCEAEHESYKNANVEHLEEKLKEAQERRALPADDPKHVRRVLIVTDGVFSMDGNLAPLDGIVALAEKYDAMVMIDDCHATGFIGQTGRGTPEHFGVVGKIDIITTTFGKALGGASGGCVSGRREIIEYLRQRARPYLFSNSLSPIITFASLKVIDLINESASLIDQLRANTARFREGMQAAGFDIKPGYAIVPVMLYNAKLASDFARDLFDEGIYVIGFSFPVVPKGQARIRVQLSAAHQPDHVDRCIAAFKKVGEKYGILGLSKKDILQKYPEAK